METNATEGTFAGKLESLGGFLFRWRGILPWLLPILFWKVFLLPEYLELTHGELVQDAYEFLCVSLSVIGLIVRFIIRGRVPPGTSGRDTKGPKAEVLNTDGFYSVVRHPIYVLGNFPIFLGLLLFTEIWWVIVPGIVLFWLYYIPIMKAEDAFLKERFGEKWRMWAAKTPLILPNLKGWQPFSRPFSWRRAIRKEYTTIFVIVGLYAMIDAFRDLLTEGEYDGFWIILLTLSGCAYAVIRFLKKHTTLLKDPH